MVCRECSAVQQAVKSRAPISGAGSYPSVRELAYMVDLEYYIEMSYRCIHEIPEKDNAVIKVKDLVKFIDENNWQMGTRTCYEGFHCTTFINRPSKKVVIVHRGTQNLQQVKTDIMSVWLAFNKITKDVISKADWHTSQSLMNNALSEQRNKFVRNDYSVTITGHSLGGWLAQICTLIAKNPQFHPIGPRGLISFPNGKSIDMNQPFDLHCVAFDSPGALAVLSKMDNDAAILSGSKNQVENAFSSLDILVYLSNSNLVNRCGKHVGKIKHIDVMSDASFFDRWFNPFASHSMDKILNYFIKNNE
jgi:hypothetical protein